MGTLGLRIVLYNNSSGVSQGNKGKSQSGTGTRKENNKIS